MRTLLRTAMALVSVFSMLVTLLVCGAAAQAATGAPADQAWLPSTPAGWPQVVDNDRTQATEITRGVEQYAETYDTVAGREHIQVLTADLADPNVRAGVVAADDSVLDPADEKTSSMADRTGAVAGVNGGYFDINATGQPLGGVISGGTMLKSPQPDFNAQLGVKPNGTFVMGPENFSGTVTDGAETYPLSSVNTESDVAAGRITEVTPDLGAASSLAAGTLVTGQVGADGSLTVQSVQTSVTSVARLAQGELGLLAGGAGGTWLADNVRAGDTVQLSMQLSPDNDLTQLVSGVTMLVKDGQVYNDPTGTPPSGLNPETAIGISEDGTHVIAVAIDGHGAEDTAIGVTPAEAAAYMVAHGTYTAELFDGGGSTTEVAREPGASTVSVLNTPSDLPGNTERPVADGLFFYSTQAKSAPAAKTVINGGAPVTTVAGGSIPVPVYATDAFGNPASGSTSVRIEPSSLASWSNGVLTPLRDGSGVIIATNGSARSVQRLDVVSRFASLAISPDTPDLGSGATQQFSLTGMETADRRISVQVPAEAATWTVNPSSLGTVDAHGLFTAATSGGGMATVTATVDGATAGASVAVGSVAELIDPMASTSEWTLSNNTTGKTATLTAAPDDVPPDSTATGSLALSYTMPAGSGVKQLVLSPQTTLRTTTDNGRTPNGIGMWIKGNGTGIELAESYIGAGGARTTLYPTTVTWNGWQFVVAQLPSGLQYPLSISFIDFLAISPGTTTTGSLEVSGLQALYSPRPLTTPVYQALPANPKWLGYREAPADFAKQGDTLLVGGDADLLASAPASTSAEAMQSIAATLPGLSPQAIPDAAQFLGDMSGDGTTADLQFAQATISALKVPGRNAVGGGEITAGKNPETGDFAQVFGATHYAYTEGAATVIVTDSAHGGILASDAYQDPAESQYQWLVQQLTDATTKDVLVATQLPAYDPTGSGKNQFTDRWEAQMYVRLLQKYQQAHPDRHVIMLAGDATGFSEQILGSTGEALDAAHGGIPQFTFADLSGTSVAAADEGGFVHFGLIRIDESGALEFAVEPVLTAITIDAPATTVPVGSTTMLTATGTEVGGGKMPIADPASHAWSSSDSRIASIDPFTGNLIAHRAGTVTVSLVSGSVVASAEVIVG